MAGDLGSGRTEYVASRQPYGPPAPGPYGLPQANYYTQYANLASQLGGGYLDQSTQAQYAGDLFNMQTAGRPNAGSLIFPQGYGGGDFALLESAADKFAAQAGWRYYPTSQQFSQMMAAGVNGGDPMQVNRWLAGVNGISGKMPWLSTGLDKQQYDEQHTSLQATMAQYTGNANTYSELISQAMSHGTAAGAWLQTQLTTNEKYTKNAQTPWLQFGLTAQEFKNQAAQNKQEITNKYGAHATTAQQADFIGNPPQARPMTSTRYAAGAVGLPTTQQGPIVQTPSGSSVR